MTFNTVRTITMEYYSIASKNTGELLKVASESNEGGYACNSHHWTLGYEGEDVYKADDYLTALYASRYSTPWYNSTEQCPDWEALNIEDDVLEVVKVVETRVLSKEPEKYALAVDYKQDLSHVEDYSRKFGAQTAKDYLKRVFIMEGETTSPSDFSIGKFIFRYPWEMLKIVEVGTDKSLNLLGHPNAYFFVVEPYTEECHGIQHS